MLSIKRYLNDVYEGIYFNSARYESVDISSWVVHLRFLVSLYFYYVSVVILAIGVTVSVYGAFKPSFILVAFYMFGLYLILYRLLIYPLLSLENFDEHISEVAKSEKIKKANRLFVGSILSFMISFFLVFLMYES
ncbi:hypothetical protein GCM10027291_43670 [Telluribacter humicola]